MKHDSKSGGVGRCRKLAALTVAMVFVSLAARHAHAELHNAVGTGSLSAATPARMDLVPRLGMITTPLFLVFPIGVSGRSSFRSSTHVEQPGMVTFGDESALCLGARCAPRDVVIDPGTAATAGSKRAVESIGVGKAALALFASPVPKRTSLVAMAVSPMFACRGTGLEMRLAWW